MSDERVRSIDLNADLGELPEALADGPRGGAGCGSYLANVACGGHAGDPATWPACSRWPGGSVSAAGRAPGTRTGWGSARSDGHVAAGDRGDRFRAVSRSPPSADRTASRDPREAPRRPLQTTRRGRGRRRRHRTRRAPLAPRGRRDRSRRFADAARLRGGGHAGRGRGFADRAYEADGMLTSRKLPGSLITDPRRAGEQAVSLATSGIAIARTGETVAVAAETICVHGDSSHVY